MNNKGFAVSGIIYGILVLFIILLIALLSMFNSRKTVLDELKEKVLNQVGSNIELKEFSYDKTNEIYEHKIQLKGYYNIILNNVNGSKLSTNIYLAEGEKLYLKIYNNIVDIYSDKQGTDLLARINTSYKLKDEFNNKYFFNTEYIKNTTEKTNKINIKYIETIRENKSMNQVRYIKDCVSGNNIDNENKWTEIRAIVKGENVALNKDVKFYDQNDIELLLENNITDNSLNTSTAGAHCIIIDLGRTYNLDYLYSYHDVEKDKRYYDYNLSVSSANIEYKTIYNYEDNNVVVSAFEKSKTKIVGNVYVPIKEFDGARWLRMYHYNNLNGTIYWDAKAQILMENGYDAVHKKSVLNYLNTFLINNKYELLLEYPEYDNTKYIRWTQTSDFTKQNTISGFKLITNNFGTTNFGGLKLSGLSNTLITTTDNKHYEIGSLNGTNGIYGFNDTLITNSVDLWIKI